MSSQTNPLHGFTTAVLPQKKEAKPSAGGASSFSETVKKRGLFLLSKDAPDKPQLKKQDKSKRGSKTRNRKTVTKKDFIAHKGITYRVNAETSGIYVQTMRSIIDQFEVACGLWSRVFVLRFDLHQEFYTKDSKLVTDFFNRLITKLKREYGFKKIGYCWAREQERAKAQHYHCVLFLDGKLVRHSSRLRGFIKQAWESPLGGFHVPVIGKPFYIGKREEIAESVIYRISYLAKARGKGYRPAQNKDFACSRMRLP